MNTVSNSEILGRISQQRAKVDAFLAAAVPRKRRLLNTTIVGGSLAAVCSVMATVATQLLKSDNVEQNVVRAQGARAKLEVIELGLKLGQLDDRQALAEYLKCAEDTAFLQV